MPVPHSPGDGPRTARAGATRLLTLEAFQAARRALSSTVLRTPLVPLPCLDTGRPLWLKAENLQVTGSFKVRGAVHRLAAVPAEERTRRVVAHSSGNHAQAVAYAARLLGVEATVLMPETATAFKIGATRALGAEVITAPAEVYRERALELAAECGGIVIPPFDDPLVMAGQGTVALEIAEDIPAGFRGSSSGSGGSGGSAGELTILAPIGGGGLLGGIAAAAKSVLPGCRVVGVEPELAADAAESRRAGRRVAWPAARTGRTIADGLRTPMVGELTWQHIQRYVDGIVTVTEDEIRAAVGVLAGRAHLVAEPSGAVATAAFLAGRVPGDGPCVAVVSGGNVHPADLAALLTPRTGGDVTRPA
ncbi:threonine ammonia-lyase [Streptomyces jumonjinensis]|uniref:threonine ammonia-lyase n=1 Tax=Streptomyces jumonjinensis TaxID=1945 RepID=A0A646KAD4_STRJU|nr:threonine/serine dehydratase [Streptomyces jumonjinensis]MQS99123.1 pyridoxal-phosphate dependent enzyme [Streptomyces jumonjinensis]